MASRALTNALKKFQKLSDSGLLAEIHQMNFDHRRRRKINFFLLVENKFKLNGRP